MSREFATQPPDFEPRAHDATAAFADTGFESLLQCNWKHHRAPKEMVSEIHRQLLLMHGMENDREREPIDAAYMVWSDDPYGGGVHFWNIGYMSSTVSEEMIQPVCDFPCYVCGEAYSTNQTWVEGALQTAERVLKRLLDAECHHA